MNNNSEFELLDILVLISFYVQIDDHKKSRKEYEYMHERLESIETKLNNVIERMEQWER